MSESDTTHDGTSRKPGADGGVHHHYYQQGADSNGRPIWSETSNQVPGSSFDPNSRSRQSAYTPNYHPGYNDHMRSRQHYDDPGMSMSARGVYLDPQMIHDIAVAVAHKMTMLEHERGMQADMRRSRQHGGGMYQGDMYDDRPSGHQRTEIVFVPPRGY